MYVPSRRLSSKLSCDGSVAGLGRVAGDALGLGLNGCSRQRAVTRPFPSPWVFLEKRQNSSITFWFVYFLYVHSYLPTYKLVICIFTYLAMYSYRHT